MRQFGNGQGAPDSLPPKAPTFSWPEFGPWLLGLLILSGVIVAVVFFGELAFPSFIVASMAASLGPIPLGLGAFEAICIAMLRSIGVPLEAALTATPLLRGLTLWAPMAPGLWLARPELSSKARAGAEFK